MAIKQLNTNQHIILHTHYPDDCCLCKAEKLAESRYNLLLQANSRIKELEEHCGQCKFCHNWTCGFCGSVNGLGEFSCNKCNGTDPQEQRIQKLEKENKLHRKWHKKPTHGPCCTCQNCGLNYDDCRCDLDEVSEHLDTAKTLLDEVFDEVADLYGEDSKWRNWLKSYHILMGHKSEQWQEGGWIDVTPCPNCKEPNKNCACVRNKCIKCGTSVGNITFTICDTCWGKNKLY